ncbi:hypothetical protein ACFFRR_009928 [Megaselia abdita]
MLNVQLFLSFCLFFVLFLFNPNKYNVLRRRKKIQTDKWRPPIYVPLFTDILFFLYRRMFPSMRLSVSGLKEDVNYCVMIEMVPITDCRYKFSGSQWVPAGGAEPQSPQRMYMHPESPALGSHWLNQPILFNKVKLTNNTLDNNGHIVLASMHKYQPRIHIIQTSDPTQIPWAPQQSFVFPETEFIAVTAYQNDRITKLKIDNNPFAKGFRETGQSRCKRKINVSGSSSSPDEKRFRPHSPSSSSVTSSSEDDVCSSGTRSPSADFITKDDVINHIRSSYYPYMHQHSQYSPSSSTTSSPDNSPTHSPNMKLKIRDDLIKPRQSSNFSISAILGVAQC